MKLRFDFFGAVSDDRLSKACSFCVYVLVCTLLEFTTARQSSSSLLFQEASKIQHMESSAKLVCDTGEGNGTPLQYSCLENPMDGGAW